MFEYQRPCPGIAFEMLGQYFVAPLGEVSEVIYPPKYTAIPNAQPWVKGVSNIRGRLLSVTDLGYFIFGQRSTFLATQKVLCISHQDQYVGLVVDQVLGIQHFNKKQQQSLLEYLENGQITMIYLVHRTRCSGYFEFMLSPYYVEWGSDKKARLDEWNRRWRISNLHNRK